MKLGVYAVKVERIIDELVPSICSFLPVHGANKLFLHYGISEIINIYSKPELEAHSNILKTGICLESIIKDEFRDKAIDFHNGISGLVFILSKLHNNDSDFSIRKYKQQLLSKIMESTFWDNPHMHDIPEQNLGFLEGVSGIGFGINLLDS